MTAPAQPEQPLRQRILESLHAVLHAAVGSPYSSTGLVAIDQTAAVLAAVQPDLDALRAEVRTLTAVCKSNQQAYKGAVLDCEQAATDLAARDAEIQRLRAAVAAVRALDPGPLVPGFVDAASEMYDDALRTAIRTLDAALADHLTTMLNTTNYPPQEGT